MIHRIWWCIKDLDNKIKWFLQRAFRGYSDPEVWDLYWHNVKWLLPRLKKLKKIQHGFPAMLLEGKKTEKEADKEWKGIIDKIISAFEFILSEEWDCDNKTQKKVYEGLDLYREYFLALWD